MRKELYSLLLELLSASDQYSYLLQEIIHINLPLIALTTTLWVAGEYIDIVLILYWYCIDIAILYFAMMWPLWSRWRDSGHYWWCSFNKHSCSRSPNDEEQRGMVLLVQLCPQYRNSFITGQCPPRTPPSSTIWSFYLLFWTRCFERFCEKIIITFPIFRIPGKCNKLKTPSHRI